MADRENVIKGLEWILNDIEENGHYQVGYYADEIRKAIALLKEQEPIIRCKDCKYGLYTGTEYLCDRHSGHANKFGEDQYYKEWHNGNWFCADGERRQEYTK